MKKQAEKPEAEERIKALAAYVPGLSIEEIRQKHNPRQIIKLASNENPLGASPLAQEAIKRHVSEIFRYPQGGNPRLRQALAKLHGVQPECVVAGNGSDELIDLLIRIMTIPGQHNMVCFKPCFSIYPVQAAINNVEIRQQALEENFSFNFEKLLTLVDADTRLVFITTPDNPSGYCPPISEIHNFASKLAKLTPAALLVIDEAYMDFTMAEKDYSLLARHILPDNTAFMRTFSKSWGLAGMRLGYAILPERLANALWSSRLPFSVNLLVEEAALAAMEDIYFREKCLRAVQDERQWLTRELRELGCQVWPSLANFIMFKLPENSLGANDLFELLLRRGIIIRQLKSYALPEHLRVSIGNPSENRMFISAMKEILQGASIE